MTEKTGAVAARKSALTRLKINMAEREGFYTAVPKFPTRLAKSLLLKDRVSAHC